MKVEEGANDGDASNGWLEAKIVVSDNRSVCSNWSTLFIGSRRLWPYTQCRPVHSVAYAFDQFGM